MGEKRDKKKSFLSRVNGLFDNSIDPESVIIYIYTHTHTKGPNKIKTRHQLFLFRYKKDLRCRHQTQDGTNGNLFSDFPFADKEFSNG